jgi:YVTN family beta-propeller protein
VSLTLVLAVATGCDDDDEIHIPPVVPDDFSNTVLPILQNSCATSGCHDAASAAVGLNLSSYGGILAGSDHGEAVIPLGPDRSLMIELLEGRAASTTVDHTAGSQSIQAEELATLRDWIDDGCPDDDGTPAFSAVTSKVYVTGQGADLISVISAEDLVVMRLVPVEPFSGSGGLNALPHFGAVSADNNIWITTMLEAPGLWKFDQRDSVLAKLETNLMSTALAVMTPDASKAYVTHFIDPQLPSQGFVTVVDIASFQVLRELPVLNTSHGIAISSDGSEVYVANFGSDHITVIDTNDDSVSPNPIPVSETVRGNIDSFEFRVIQIATHPTEPLIYASCSATNEIRVIDRQLETVVDSLTVPAGSAAPWHLKVTPDGSKLSVATRGQQMGGQGLLPGSVSVFSTSPFALVANITDESLWLTHGVDFDASGRYCFVSSENANEGYSARHPLAGDDPPGTVVVIDTSTDQLIKVLEVEPFATGVFATR